MKEENYGIITVFSPLNLTDLEIEELRIKAHNETYDVLTNRQGQEVHIYRSPGGLGVGLANPFYL